MDIVARVQGILIKPKDEWQKIKKEPHSVSQLFTSYVLLLAAVPAAAQFLRYGLVGFRIPFEGWYRFDVGMALLRAVLVYGFILVFVYVFGFVINTLASTFSSTQNLNTAMKLAVYSTTPFFVASVLYLIPFLDRLVILASFYGIYLLYLGFVTPLVDAPKDKILAYLVVSVVLALVAAVILLGILDTIFVVGRVSRVL